MSIKSSVVSKLSPIHTMKHCATVKINDTEICALIKKTSRYVFEEK